MNDIKVLLETYSGETGGGSVNTAIVSSYSSYDPFTVYVQTTELTVGFFNPAKRSHVLDPRLTHIPLIPLILIILLDISNQNIKYLTATPALILEMFLSSF